MTDLILATFDRVPELPRGYVRDIRVRWALEEAGLPYRVRGVPSASGMPSISGTSPLVRYRPLPTK